MKHVYNDGGRSAAGFKGSAGDCVVRAVAIATGQDYTTVYDALSEGCRTQRLTRRSRVKPSARNGVNVRRKWFRDYMAALGWVWTPTMGIGTGCTVHLTDGELPSGRLIVSVSRHYTTVIDGVVHDTHDPQRGVHWVAPYRGESLKRGQNLSTDGQSVTWIERRCVYGYWSRKQEVTS